MVVWEVYHSGWENGYVPSFLCRIICPSLMTPSHFTHSCMQLCIYITVDPPVVFIIIIIILAFVLFYDYIFFSF